MAAAETETPIAISPPDPFSAPPRDNPPLPTRCASHGRVREWGNPELVGPASVDITLAPSFRVFRKVPAVIDVGEDTDYRQLTDKITVPGGGRILIMPGETVLGISRERVRLGPLAVHPGTAICQFVFQKLEGTESYAGRLAGQTEDSF
jgi:dCTP deaminase